MTSLHLSRHGNGQTPPQRLALARLQPKRWKEGWRCEEYFCPAKRSARHEDIRRRRRSSSSRSLRVQCLKTRMVCEEGARCAIVVQSASTSSQHWFFPAGSGAHSRCDEYQTLPNAQLLGAAVTATAHGEQVPDHGSTWAPTEDIVRCDTRQVELTEICLKQRKRRSAKEIRREQVGG